MTYTAMYRQLPREYQHDNYTEITKTQTSTHTSTCTTYTSIRYMDVPLSVYSLHVEKSIGRIQSVSRVRISVHYNFTHQLQ